MMVRSCLLLRSLATALFAFSLVFNAQGDFVRPYPVADNFLVPTEYLDHASYLQDLDDNQWYIDNIPFVDFPDKSMQDVYYYRASVVKRHLRWAHEGHGWVVTEFIHPVDWASKFQTIPDSAALHILETRWLRDPVYSKNLIELYTRGGVEKLSGISYTHFIHTAILEHARTTGDVDFLVSQLDGMITTYNLWNATQDNTTGLYYRTPLSDAQEYSLPGYLVGGPNGGPMQVWNDFGLSPQEGGGNDYGLIFVGPDTYRPSENAYMIAGARAIGTVANLTGDSSLAAEWIKRASALEEAMQSEMWSDELQFWIDVVRNPELPCQGRELIGYFPYRFGVGTNDTYIRGLEAGLTTERFLTEFGPTTLEQENQYYSAFKNSTYCCVWNGQSWPFSTSTYLQTLAMIARENVSSIITPDFFQDALDIYVRTNYKDGVPYTAESHYPTIDIWSGDTSNHSENYLHSTFMDNVFTNLVGIVPTLEDELVLQPLVPSNWSYFAVENLPYHGTLMTIIWDSDGSHYNIGNGTSGLSVFSNGTLIHNQATLAATTITLPFKSQEAANALAAAAPEYQNIFGNVNSPWGLPSITADFVWSTNGDIEPYQPWKMNDGLLWYDTTPDNRWTNNQSTTPYNNMYLTLPRARQINSVSLAIMDDTSRGGVVACPEAIRVTNRDGDLLAERNPWTDCVGNALNTILFAKPSNNTKYPNDTTAATGTTTETDYLQVTISNKLGFAVAITEVQIWVPPNPGPKWEIEDGLIGTFIGIFGANGMNGTITDGGVELNEGAWVELGGVRTSSGEGGPATLVVLGRSGAVTVGVNWLSNHTLEFGDTAQNLTLDVDLLRGNNVVTFKQTTGSPWLDSLVVS